jgi:hypothetical protein
MSTVRPAAPPRQPAACDEVDRFAEAMKQEILHVMLTGDRPWPDPANHARLDLGEVLLRRVMSGKHVEIAIIAMHMWGRNSDPAASQHPTAPSLVAADVSHVVDPLDRIARAYDELARCLEDEDARQHVAAAALEAQKGRSLSGIATDIASVHDMFRVAGPDDEVWRSAVVDARRHRQMGRLLGLISRANRYDREAGL